MALENNNQIPTPDQVTQSALPGLEGEHTAPNQERQPVASTGAMIAAELETEHPPINDPERLVERIDADEAIIKGQSSDNVNWVKTIRNTPTLYEREIRKIINTNEFNNYLQQHPEVKAQLEERQKAIISPETKDKDKARKDYLDEQARIVSEYLDTQPDDKLSDFEKQTRDEIKAKAKEIKAKIDRDGEQAAIATLELLKEIPNSNIEADPAFIKIITRLEKHNRQTQILSGKPSRTKQEQELLNELRQSLRIRAVDLFFHNTENVERFREKKIYKAWTDMRDANAKAIKEAEEASLTFLDKRRKKKGLPQLIRESKDYNGDPALWFAGWLRGDEAASNIWKDRAKWPMGTKIAIGLMLFGPGILAFAGPILLLYMRSKNAKQEDIDALSAINEAVEGKLKDELKKEEDEKKKKLEAEAKAAREEQERAQSAVTPAPAQQTEAQQTVNEPTRQTANVEAEEPEGTASEEDEQNQA